MESRNRTTMDPWTYGDVETIGVDVTQKLDLTGYGVEAIDGGIGKVDEATYEASSSYIVVDTGPWILGKKVLLPAGWIPTRRRSSSTARRTRSRTRPSSTRTPIGTRLIVPRSAATTTARTANQRVPCRRRPPGRRLFLM